MTAVQEATRTRLEPLNVGFVFQDDKYSLTALATRISGLNSLLVVATEAVENPGRTQAKVPTWLVGLTVKRVRMESPLEIWVSVAMGSSAAAVMLADKLVNLARGMSALRVDFARDSYDQARYRHAKTLLGETAIGSDHDQNVIDRAANALVALEVLAVEQSDEVEGAIASAVPPPPTGAVDAHVDLNDIRGELERIRRLLEGPPRAP